MNVNLHALREIYDTGDTDFLAFANAVVEDTMDLRKRMAEKGWFGNGL